MSEPSRTPVATASAIPARRRAAPSAGGGEWAPPSSSSAASSSAAFAVVGLGGSSSAVARAAATPPVPITSASAPRSARGSCGVSPNTITPHMTDVSIPTPHLRADRTSASQTGATCSSYASEAVLAATALRVSAEYPRDSRGVAAIRPRHIHSAGVPDAWPDGRAQSRDRRPSAALRRRQRRGARDAPGRERRSPRRREPRARKRRQRVAEAHDLRGRGIGERRTCGRGIGERRTWEELA